MAINRYSRGPIAADVQSTFVPLPIDLMDRQIQRKQSQFDTAQASIGASQEATYGVKGVTQDVDALKEIQSTYDESVTQAIEEAGGDYSRLTSFSDELGRKISKDIKTGHLGAIHNNFVRAQNHMQTLTDAKEKNNISEAGYNKGLASISAFGGTVEDGKGGYTKASLYTPAKYLELGTTADIYGTKIKDQYDAQGRRYIGANKATELIEQNMYNNPQAMENVREQVWATYGELPPEEQRLKVAQYVRGVSRASGNKLAFREIYKPTGDSTLTGGAAVVVNAVGSKPLGIRIKGSSANLGKLISNIESPTSPVVSTLLSIGAGVGPDGSAGFDPVASEEIKKARDAKASANVEKNKQELVKLIKDDPIMMALALDEGIPIAEYNKENFEKLDGIINEYNKSSSETQMVLSNNSKTKESFNSLIMNPTYFMNSRVSDFTTGAVLTGEEKDEALARHREALSKSGADGTDVYVYGGEIQENLQGRAQPYAPGTISMASVGPKGSSKLMVEPNAGNNPNVQRDRMRFAFENKIATFRNGPKTMTYLRTKEGLKVFSQVGKGKVKEEGLIPMKK